MKKIKVMPKRKSKLVDKSTFEPKKAPAKKKETKFKPRSFEDYFEDDKK